MPEENIDKYKNNGLTWISNLSYVTPRDSNGNISLQESGSSNPILIIEPSRFNYTLQSVRDSIETNFKYFSFPVTTVNDEPFDVIIDPTFVDDLTPEPEIVEPIDPITTKLTIATEYDDKDQPLSTFKRNGTAYESLWFYNDQRVQSGYTRIPFDSVTPGGGFKITEAMIDFVSGSNNVIKFDINVKFRSVNQIGDKIYFSLRLNRNRSDWTQDLEIFNPIVLYTTNKNDKDDYPVISLQYEFKPTTKDIGREYYVDVVSGPTKPEYIPTAVNENTTFWVPNQEVINTTTTNLRGKPLTADLVKLQEKYASGYFTDQCTWNVDVGEPAPVNKGISYYGPTGLNVNTQLFINNIRLAYTNRNDPKVIQMPTQAAAAELTTALIDKETKAWENAKETAIKIARDAFDADIIFWKKESAAVKTSDQYNIQNYNIYDIISGNVATAINNYLSEEKKKIYVYKIPADESYAKELAITTVDKEKDKFYTNNQTKISDLNTLLSDTAAGKLAWKLPKKEANKKGQFSQKEAREAINEARTGVTAAISDSQDPDTYLLLALAVFPKFADQAINDNRPTYNEDISYFDKLVAKISDSALQSYLSKNNFKIKS